MSANIIPHLPEIASPFGESLQLQFVGQLPELTIENVKLKIVVFPSEMNLNCRQRRHHNFQLSIFNFSLGNLRLPDKLQVGEPTVFQLRTFVVDNPWDSD